jgi:hypothetical protein
MIFRAVNNDSIINTVFTIAGYTYGPILGLFSFGLFTKINIKDKWVPLVVILAPILSYFINVLCIEWFEFYLGYTLLLINASITFLGLWIIKKEEIV